MQKEIRLLMTLAEAFQAEMHKSLKQNPGDQKESTAKSSDEATKLSLKFLRWHWRRLQCQWATGSDIATGAGAHPLQKPEKFQAKPTYPPLEVKNARIQRITMFTRLTCWNWSWKCRTDLLTLQETSQETHLRFKFLFESEPSKIDRNPNASTRSTHVPQGKEKNCSRKVFGKKLFKRFLTKK